MTLASKTARPSNHLGVERDYSGSVGRQALLLADEVGQRGRQAFAWGLASRKRGPSAVAVAERPGSNPVSQVLTATTVAAPTETEGTKTLNDPSAKRIVALEELRAAVHANQLELLGHYREFERRMERIEHAVKTATADRLRQSAA